MQILSIKNLSKTYNSYSNNLQRFGNWFGLKNQPIYTYNALKDISFNANQGESIAILGQNGAGKSTLLKLITGTIRPSSGSIKVGGRISAMLELGLGFNSELTGRQNVYLAGGLMGYSQNVLTELMPSIQAFADIGDFFEQPLRVYSSGMQARLAFGVATATRPEVLIVDEVLSVGDAAFQRKCFQRIEGYRALGTTLIFVSHDTETVKKICDYGLFLNNGHVAFFGDAKTACDTYEQVLFGSTPKHSDTPNKLPKTTSVTKLDTSLSISCEMSYGNGKADIESCWLENEHGEHINIIETGENFIWCYRVRFNQQVNDPIFAMMLKTAEGVAIYGVDSTKLAIRSDTYAPNQMVNVQFKLQNTLAPGTYFLNCGVRLHESETAEFLSRRVDAAMLKVIKSESSTVSLGLVELHSKLEVNAVE